LEVHLPRTGRIGTISDSSPCCVVVVAVPVCLCVCLGPNEEQRVNRERDKRPRAWWWTYRIGTRGARWSQYRKVVGAFPLDRMCGASGDAPSQRAPVQHPPTSPMLSHPAVASAWAWL
jgi:hypothetical protein